MLVLEDQGWEKGTLFFVLTGRLTLLGYGVGFYLGDQLGFVPEA